MERMAIKINGMVYSMYACVDVTVFTGQLTTTHAFRAFGMHALVFMNKS